MSAGITFGAFALEAFTKLQKGRTTEGRNGQAKGKLIHTETDTGAASAAAVASPARKTARTPTHCIRYADTSSPFIQPNSFAGKRELSQFLRTNRERPATAWSCSRQQTTRPKWCRPPIFAFDTKPAAGQIESSQEKGTRLHVTGSPVKMTARTKPLLWLSLEVNWSRSGAAQKAALKRIYEFTKRRPLMKSGKTTAYQRRGYHKGHLRHSSSKSKKKSKAKRYTVACDFCTYINSVRRRNARCQMCGAQLPDPETANNMDQVLPCGLTARQLYELQNREITAEDFEMLCILDEGVAKKTLDKATVDKFETGKVTEAGQQCGVCQCDLDIGENMTCLPCGHKFHSECINEWLLKYNNSCPFKCSWGGA